MADQAGSSERLKPTEILYRGFESFAVTDPSILIKHGGSEIIVEAKYLEARLRDIRDRPKIVRDGGWKVHQPDAIEIWRQPTARLALHRDCMPI